MSSNSRNNFSIDNYAEIVQSHSMDILEAISPQMNVRHTHGNNQQAHLDLDLARNRGFLRLKYSNLALDLSESQSRFNRTMARAIESDEKIRELQDCNDKLKKGLECSICLQVYSVPIVIPCSHSFCYECILKCFSPPTGKGSDRTFFQVEKCPICRGPIRLDMTPSLVLRDMADVALTGDADRKEKIKVDLAKLKKHMGCIRLGAHCSGKMCLRPRSANKTSKTTQPPPVSLNPVNPINNPPMNDTNTTTTNTPELATAAENVEDCPPLTD